MLEDFSFIVIFLKEVSCPQSSISSLKVASKGLSAEKHIGEKLLGLLHAIGVFLYFIRDDKIVEDAERCRVEWMHLTGFMISGFRQVGRMGNGLVRYEFAEWFCAYKETN